MTLPSYDDTSTYPNGPCTSICGPYEMTNPGACVTARGSTSSDLPLAGFEAERMLDASLSSRCRVSGTTAILRVVSPQNWPVGQVSIFGTNLTSSAQVSSIVMDTLPDLEFPAAEYDNANDHTIVDYSSGLSSVLPRVRTRLGLSIILDVASAADHQIFEVRSNPAAETDVIITGTLNSAGTVTCSLQIGSDTVTVTSTTNYESTNLNHLALDYREGTLILYTNGTQEDSDTDANMASAECWPIDRVIVGDTSSVGLTGGSRMALLEIRQQLSELNSWSRDDCLGSTRFAGPPLLRWRLSDSGDGNGTDALEDIRGIDGVHNNQGAAEIFYDAGVGDTYSPIVSAVDFYNGSFSDWGCGFNPPGGVRPWHGFVYDIPAASTPTGYTDDIQNCIRRMVITITDSTNTDGYLEFGWLMVGPAWYTTSSVVPFQIGAADETDITFGRGSGAHIVKRRPRRRSTISFSNPGALGIGFDEGYRFPLEGILEGHGVGGRVVVQPEMAASASDNLVQSTIPGIITDAQNLTQRGDGDPAAFDWSLSVESVH